MLVIDKKKGQHTKFVEGSRVDSGRLGPSPFFCYFHGPMTGRRACEAGQGLWVVIYGVEGTRV